MKAGSWMTGVCWMAVLGASCAPQSVLRKYYTIEIPSLPDTTAASSERLPLTVAFRGFDVDRAFDQNRIALRSDSRELSYYQYHLWAVRPSTAISNAVFRVLEQASVFEKFFLESQTDLPYILTGSIVRLERTLDGKKETAHLQGEFLLLNGETFEPEVRHSFDRYGILKSRGSMNTFAETVGRLLGEETGLFVRALRDKFLQRNGNEPQ